MTVTTPLTLRRAFLTLLLLACALVVSGVGTGQVVVQAAHEASRSGAAWVTVGLSGHSWHIRFTQAQEDATLHGATTVTNTAPQGYTYLLVFLDVQNRDWQPQEFFADQRFQLVYATNHAACVAAAKDEITVSAVEFKRRFVTDTLKSRETAHEVLPFLVPQRVSAFTLVSSALASNPTCAVSHAHGDKALLSLQRSPTSHAAFLLSVRAA